ncbi:MAG: hypothetical protein Q7J16_04745 [Candidatus Cloacimonadales bacterium]|nr:hypothetical protein [Candidatus Cloacimonadales bacterium]
MNFSIVLFSLISGEEIDLKTITSNVENILEDETAFQRFALNIIRKNVDEMKSTELGSSRICWQLSWEMMG